MVIGVFVDGFIAEDIETMQFFFVKGENGFKQEIDLNGLVFMFPIQQELNLDSFAFDHQLIRVWH